LHYTLDVYEDALGPHAESMIDSVKELQDAAGALHDASVAADRIRYKRRSHRSRAVRDAADREIRDRERIQARARPEVKRRLEEIQGPGFRTELAARLISA
jgi:CHAD domain-containing protein